MSGTLYQIQLAELKQLLRESRDSENLEARRTAEYVSLRNYLLADTHAKVYKSHARRTQLVATLTDELPRELSDAQESSTR